MSPPIKYTSWMLLRLGLETQPHHVTADEDRLTLMDVRSVADYRAQLARIYGFEAAVETALVSFADVRDRAKAHLLRADLQACGMTGAEVDALPRCPVRFGSLTQALGWLYVIERQTLLAGLIRRQLEHRFRDELGGATSYLAAYGERPGARFRLLCSILDAHAALDARFPTLIAAAACEAFRCQRQWYRSEALDLSALEPVATAAFLDRRLRRGDS